MSELKQGEGAGKRPEFRPGGGLSIFEPLRIPQYRRYMVAFIGSGVAFQTSQMALGWQTFELTGDAGALGAVLFVFGIAIVIGSLIGGVAADRYSRATIIVSMQALNCVMVIGLAVAIVLDAVALWQMYGMAAIAGATQAGHLPARQAFIFNIVGRPFLPSALALNTSVMNVLRLGAPAIAGVLIGLVGVETVWFVAAGGLMVSVVIMLFVVGPSVQEYSDESRSPLRSLVEGFGYLRSNKTLLMLVSMTLGTAMIGFPFRDLMPAFASDALDQGPEGFGLVLSMLGVGALLGSLTIAFVVQVRRKGPVILMFGLVWGALLAGLSFAPNVGLSIPLLLGLGWASVGFQNFMSIMVQTKVDDAYRGRITSFQLVTFGLHPIGTLGLGLLAEAMGIRAAFFVAGLMLASYIAILGVWRRDLRELS